MLTTFKNKMFRIPIILFGIVASAPAFPSKALPTLCTSQETSPISFKTSFTGKIASICAGPGDSYLVYRFGKPGAIELIYPERLTKDSWRRFTFSGCQRPGGPANDGMGDYSLEFASKGTTYTIYQQWKDLKKSYHVGISIETKERHFDMVGVASSQSGSLVLLEGKDLLSNQDDGQ